MRIHYAIMSNEILEASYQGPYIAWGYDALAELVFAPMGGLDRLREEALAHLGVARGTRVLELGCGSGGITQRLVELGAEVTAVDWSRPMLLKASRRAPTARFERAEITSLGALPSTFDLALFSFVLHELNADSRKRALAVAARALTGQGRIGIIDHALPEQGLVARSMSCFVHSFEPASSRAWLAEGAAEEALRDAGFEPQPRRRVASGMAFALAAARSA